MVCGLNHFGPQPFNFCLLIHVSKKGTVLPFLILLLPLCIHLITISPYPTLLLPFPTLPLPYSYTFLYPTSTLWLPFRTQSIYTLPYDYPSVPCIYLPYLSILAESKCAN